MEILTKNATQTKKLGEILAKEVLKTKFKRAVLLALFGDLGGGKTTFLKGFAKGLGIREKILSPTFVLVKRFEIKDSNFKNFYHIDCYRIKKPTEILKLGFKEIVSDPKNIVAVEWAERVKKIFPKNYLKIEFNFLNKNSRKIRFNFCKGN